MTVEDYQTQRLFCIAQMAATIQAGREANPQRTGESGESFREWMHSVAPANVVDAAVRLFEAAERAA